MRYNRVPDPAWKSGPKAPKASDEHAIHPEDFGRRSDADWDGFGADEARDVNGEPLVALQERVTCSREGCDEALTRRVLFTTEPLSNAEEHALDRASGVDEPSAYVWENGERVGPETIVVDSTEIPAETIVRDEPASACYARVEPDPEPEWRDL